MLFTRRGTIIAEGLKITGSVAAEGMVQVNGQIDGEAMDIPHNTTWEIKKAAQAE